MTHFRNRALWLVASSFLLMSSARAAHPDLFDLQCIYIPRQGTILDNKRTFMIDEAAHRVDGYAAEISQTAMVWVDSNGARWRIDRINGRFSETRNGDLFAGGPCQRTDKRKF
jgi:hypothetical protein